MPSKKQTYRGISNRTKQLINGAESMTVDFKRTAQVDSEDLVAFANSESGGTLLLGVDEYEGTDGHQKGKIVGCQVSDKHKLNIINKALSCFPPVEIEVIVENTAAQAFYRIEIPSSPFKPHCTARGTYKIRENGRNKAIEPQQLLSIFLSMETGRFLERFKGATEELESKLIHTFELVNDQKDMLSDNLLSLDKHVDEIKQSLNNKLMEIFGKAITANLNAEEALDFSENTFEIAEDIKEDIDHTNLRLLKIEKMLEQIYRQQKQ